MVWMIRCNKILRSLQTVYNTETRIKKTELILTSYHAPLHNGEKPYAHKVKIVPA